MPQPSTSSTQPDDKYLRAEVFSLGIEGEHWHDKLKLLVIPRRGQKAIAVARFKSNADYMLIWDNNHRRYPLGDELSLIARIYELIETP